MRTLLTTIALLLAACGGTAQPRSIKTDTPASPIEGELEAMEVLVEDAIQAASEPPPPPPPTEEERLHRKRLEIRKIIMDAEHPDDAKESATEEVDEDDFMPAGTECMG